MLIKLSPYRAQRLTAFLNINQSVENYSYHVKQILIALGSGGLIGVGIGNFPRGMEEYVPRTTSGIQLLQPVHNIPLLWISEIGVLGSVLYIALLVNILRKKIKKLTLLSVLVIISVLGIALFDHYFFSLPQGMIIGGIFFILLCIDQ